MSSQNVVLQGKEYKKREHSLTNRRSKRLSFARGTPFNRIILVFVFYIKVNRLQIYSI